MVHVHDRPSTRPAWPGITHGAELSPSPVSLEAFNFIQSCLQACNESHENCYSMLLLKPPTRLIDVQPHGLSSTYVRLVETQSHTPL